MIDLKFPSEDWDRTWTQCSKPDPSRSFWFSACGTHRSSMQIICHGNLFHVWFCRRVLCSSAGWHALKTQESGKKAAHWHSNKQQPTSAAVIIVVIYLLQSSSSSPLGACIIASVPRECIVYILAVCTWSAKAHFQFLLHHNRWWLLMYDSFRCALKRKLDKFRRGENNTVGIKEASIMWMLHLYFPSTYIICYESISRKVSSNKSYNLNVIYLM